MISKLKVTKLKYDLQTQGKKNLNMIYKLKVTKPKHDLQTQGNKT